MTLAGSTVLSGGPRERRLAARRHRGGGRHGQRRHAEHDRIRLFRHRPQSALRHAAQPERTGPARSPGGSSSGCGVAVAARLLPCAIGTDTGGSIRIPASFNGVIGYKSSTGRYSMRGVFPLSRTSTRSGRWRTASPTACWPTGAARRGRHAGPPRRSRRARRADQCRLHEAQTAVADNFERALQRLPRQGPRSPASPVAVRRDPFAERRARSPDCRRGAIRASGDHRQRAGGDHGRARGEAHPGGQEHDRRRFAVDPARAAALIAENGALLGPFSPSRPRRIALEIAPLEADQETFFSANLKTLRNTMLGNVLDLCGVAVPERQGCRRHADRLPAFGGARPATGCSAPRSRPNASSARRQPADGGAWRASVYRG